MEHARLSCSKLPVVCFKSFALPVMVLLAVVIFPLSASEVSQEERSRESVVDAKYSELRVDVSVRKLNSTKDHFSQPRNSHFYQLAGVANKQLCHDVLTVFNETGDYKGPDLMEWLLDNSRRIHFDPLIGNAPASRRDRSFFVGVEFAVLDIDRDGESEYIYRSGGVVSDNRYQRIMIVSEPLQDNPEILEKYADLCVSIESENKCMAKDYIIKHAIIAKANHRLEQEWGFTRYDALYMVTSDKDSRELIFPYGGNRAYRNIGSASLALWNFYKLESGVVAVATPSVDFAYPELLIFSPEKEGLANCNVY